jgi:hypothetical protein
LYIVYHKNPVEVRGLWQIFLRDVVIKGSLDLLNLMLQTDPKKRITVQQLLTHPWLMDGYDKPVKYQSR